MDNSSRTRGTSEESGCGEGIQRGNGTGGCPSFTLSRQGWNWRWPSPGDSLRTGPITSSSGEHFQTLSPQIPLPGHFGGL